MEDRLRNLLLFVMRRLEQASKGVEEEVEPDAIAAYMFAEDVLADIKEALEDMLGKEVIH